MVYLDLHENHKKSTIHVGEYTSPMDPMGFVGIQTAKNDPPFLSVRGWGKSTQLRKKLRIVVKLDHESPKNQMKMRNRWNEVTLAGWFRKKITQMYGTMFIQD